MLEREGLESLHGIAKDAVARLANSGDPFEAKKLFTAGERREIADLIASASAMGELMGRARVRKMAERVVKKHAEGSGKPCGDSHISADKTCKIGAGTPPKKRSKPSIGLKRVGDEWRQEDGSPLPEHLKKSAIPPAWTNVQINPDPDADLQVTGFDSKGRMHSRYSESHAHRQAERKFQRISELMEKERTVRRENEAAMKSDDPMKREAAAVTSLIFATGLRPGSERDTGAKRQAYGATTLEGRHVVESPDGVRLKFVGKKGVDLDIPVKDAAVASMLVERKQAAGNAGKLFHATDSDLRDHVHSLDGGKFKPKDLRTLRGTSEAAKMIRAKPGCCKDEKEYKRAVKEVAVAVSEKLGNTPAIALKAYIAPSVFSQWRVAQ